MGFRDQELGELDRAVRSLWGAVECGPDTPLMRAFLARTLAAAGQIEEATIVLGDLLQLRETNCIPATSIALIYAALNQREQAWSWADDGDRRNGPVALPHGCGPPV